MALHSLRATRSSALYQSVSIMYDLNYETHSNTIRTIALSWKTREGALQQYARMPADHLLLRPANIKPTEAAGLTLAGQTAWQALFNVGKFEPGQTIFINGGSTAVGAFAIQIAKAKGAEKVVASASGKNEAFVRELGADEFIDYTKEPLHLYLEKNPPNVKYHIFFDAGRSLCLTEALCLVFTFLAFSSRSRRTRLIQSQCCLHRTWWDFHHGSGRWQYLGVTTNARRSD
jgi:NADPH:quinone reductase-like Zn-dependent oxidoreductase